MSHVLVTGFEPFATHAVNPSALVAEALGRLPGVESYVLPVVYDGVMSQLEPLLMRRPRAVVMLGVHNGPEVRLERVARNAITADTPDNIGVVPTKRHIVEGAPGAYASTLPLEAMHDVLSAAGVAVTWSDAAGGYLCNYVFYRARRWFESRAECVPCGFVHVPIFDHVDEPTQVQALSRCLETLG